MTNYPAVVQSPHLYGQIGEQVRLLNNNSMSFRAWSGTGPTLNEKREFSCP
jgi:hypothetical protein